MSEFKNLITLTQVSDGAPGEPGAPGKDGGGYYIETNQEEVLCFYKKNGRNLSPQTLEISLYKLPLEENGEKIDFSDGYDFGYIDDNGEFRSLLGENYKTYYSIGLKGTEEGTIQEGTENVLFYRLQNLIELKNDKEEYIFDSNLLLKFIYFQDKKETAIKTISLRDGVSEEMAQFNIEATNINAAVRNSKMEFSEDGLKIFGTGFEIWDSKTDLFFITTDEDFDSSKIYYEYKEGSYIETTDSEFKNDKNYYEKKTPVRNFYADEGGNLHLRGNLEAATGSFEGTIHATNATFENGEIGGFTIEGSRLISQNQDIILDGSQGIIEANSIKLGTGATIETYIQLGNARLYNPNDPEANGAVLKSGNITINQNGTASFGSIKISGDESRIQGDNWNITPGRAEFNNIVISGSIETAVFKTATTQAVGSAMLFMQSYKIESINGNVITVDQNVEGDISADTLVWLVNNNLYFSYTVQSVSGTNIILDIPTETIVEATTIIVIGEEADKPLVFGVNSGNTKVANNLIYQRGLTINEYGNTGLPHLFLGDLRALNNDENINYTGYGLYSDNVYLNGSLTTKVGENSYAGINTLNGVSAIAFSTAYEGKNIPTEIDTSKIVFWAGASSTSANDIQNAYFQITEQGSIYASRAKLTNSLFVGGEISGADIYTARIHGTGNTNQPALTIYDTSRGISFKTGYENDKQSSGIETFSIQNTGLKVGDNEFISINGSQVAFIGDKIQTKGTTNYLSLTVIDSVPVLYHEHSQSKKCGFYFEEGKTSYKINKNTRMNWSENDVKILGTVSFAKNEQDTSFQYRPNEGGYDLYILSNE